MAETPDYSELLRRAALTNIGYYEAWLKLSASYLDNLKAVLGDGQGSTAAAAASDTPRAKAAALVLEAEAGSRAESRFVVENELARHVTADIAVSPVIDAAGNAVAQNVQLAPSTVDLDPGERVIVRVTADIGEALDPGAGYRCSITVPDLSDTPAAVVIRRRHSVGEPPSAASGTRKTAGSRAKKRKKTAAKKVSRKQGD